MNGYFDSAYEFLGFNIPTKLGYWSMNVLYFHSGEINWYDNNEIVSTFSEKSMSLVVNYGYPFIQKNKWELSGGVNGNLIYQDIARANDKVLIGDIGVIGKFSFLKFFKSEKKNLLGSFSLRNIGGKIKGNDLPLIFDGEIGYQFLRYIGLVHHISYYNKEEWQNSLAMEVNYAFFILRFGKTFSTIRNNYSAGLGIKISDKKTDYIFDYAIVSSQIVDEYIHCFSLSITL